MSTGKHNRVQACFFWIGIAMGVACFAVVLARDTKLVARFEKRDLPLSGAFLGVAALAFLATELCDSLRNPRSDQPSRYPSEGPHEKDQAHERHGR